MGHQRISNKGKLTTFAAVNTKKLIEDVTVGTMSSVFPNGTDNGGKLEIHDYGKVQTDMSCSGRPFAMMEVRKLLHYTRTTAVYTLK